MEGPKAPSEVRRREAPREVGRCSPSPVWESGGYAPRKFLKFNMQFCAFLCIFVPIFTLNLMEHVLSLDM